jgi:PHD/YefM family antitoxin component YafN of YafNO toxin-antitoxin module
MTKKALEEAIATITSVTITDFKERAREVVSFVAERGPVAILRHKTVDAVLISASAFVEYAKLKRERLDFLTRRYDELVSSMQTPQAAAGVDALFNATPDDLGRAALAAAKRA